MMRTYTCVPVGACILAVCAAVATRLWGDAPDVIATVGLTWDF